MEVERFVPQELIRERIAEQTVGFSVPSIKDEIVEVVFSGFFLVPQRAKIGRDLFRASFCADLF